MFWPFVRSSSCFLRILFDKMCKMVNICLALGLVLASSSSSSTCNTRGQWTGKYEELQSANSACRGLWMGFEVLSTCILAKEKIRCGCWDYWMRWRLWDFRSSYKEKEGKKYIMWVDTTNMRRMTQVALLQLFTTLETVSTTNWN